MKKNNCHLIFTTYQNYPLALNSIVRDEQVFVTEISISTLIPVSPFHMSVLLNADRAGSPDSEHGLGVCSKLCACLLK